MYAVIVTFVTKPEATERFHKRMIKQAQESLANEEGCLTFDVWTAKEAPATIFLYEIYADRAAFDEHVETAHFKSFDADVKGMVVNKTVLLQDQALCVGTGSSSSA
ncbi:MAG: putative quinol monooxygenase [Stappiaceae bacterium]